MNIPLRIAAGFGLVMFILGVPIWIGLRSMDQIEAGRRQMVTASELLEDADALHLQVLGIQRGVLLFLESGNRSAVQHVSDDDRRLGELLDEVASRAESSARSELVARLVDIRATYMEAFGRLVEDRLRRDQLFVRGRTLAREIADALDRLPDEADGVLATRAAFGRADHALLRYVQEPDSNVVGEARAAIRVASEGIDRSGDPSLEAAFAEYERTALQTVQAIRGHLFLANVVLAGQTSEFEYVTQKIRAEAIEQRQAQIVALDELTIEVEQRSKVVASLAILIGAVVALRAGRGIAVPLVRITETFNDLAAGRGVARIPETDRSDEIGDLAKAAEVFNARNQQTERMNAELEQFAYVASHDLQEPLRMVSAYVQLLSEECEGKLGEDAEEYIGFAVEGASRMQELINDLLNLSRLGGQGFEMESVDTGEVLDLVVKDQALRLEEIGGEVIRGALPKIRGVPSQIQQVFQNFLTNAIKYRRPDVPFRFEVRAQRLERRWRFSFADDGIGIDPRHHEQIFKIFQRLHSVEGCEGSGMGLAIVKKIAEQHDGRVWLDSTPGEGTTFYFEIGDA